MKNSVLSIYENWFFSGVDEYIKSGSKEAIVDRDPELIYTKREKLLENKKTAAKKRLWQEPRTPALLLFPSFKGSSITQRVDRESHFRKWPFFLRYRDGKICCTHWWEFGLCRLTVRTELKKATFVKDVYLKEIESTVTRGIFSGVANVRTPFQRTIPFIMSF